MIRPRCEGASCVFHEEYVGDSLPDPGGRLFDILTRQIARNGDAERRLVLEMDIVGAASHEGVRPFPSRANDLLFVSKRIAQVNASGAAGVPPTGLDRPNYPGVRDCQPHSQYCGSNPVRPITEHATIRVLVAPRHRAQGTE